MDDGFPRYFPCAEFAPFTPLPSSDKPHTRSPPPPLEAQRFAQAQDPMFPFPSIADRIYWFR